MTFTSLSFLFVFLPVTWLINRFLPSLKIRNIFLILASWLFYAWSGPSGLVILTLMTFLIYFSGLLLNTEKVEENLARRRAVFWISVGLLVYLLFFYKYLKVWLSPFINVASLDIVAPVGLSFYTFSAISYLADVYMRKSPPCKSFLDMALFVSFFGKVTMGPIVEYHSFSSQLSNRPVTRNQMYEASALFIRGFAKKALIADQLANCFSQLNANSTALGAWVCMLAYVFQLYFDFSGYSDMAIAVGRFFGFELPVNFDHPFRADSVKDIWNRWHISLSHWFRDYIYFPLGGSRCSKLKAARNLMIVWILTGIWHGASLNFLAWGLYFGILLCIEKFVLKDRWNKVNHMARVLIIFMIFCFGFVFFYSTSLSNSFFHYKALFGMGEGGMMDARALFVLREYFLLLVTAAIFSGNMRQTLQNQLIVRCKRAAPLILVVLYLLIGVLALAMVIGSTSQAFLYAAF